jgi:hypothetical protein
MKTIQSIYLPFVIGCCIISSSAFAQVDNKIWKSLSSVSYTIEEDESGSLYVPKFSDAAKQLEGKTVSVSGYIVPFDGMFKPQHMILSALPLSSCFFCGVGGPETVMEVFLKEPIKYTESPVTVTGKLKLNATDYEKLMYVLEDAEYEGVAE